MNEKFNITDDEIRIIGHSISSDTGVENDKSLPIIVKSDEIKEKIPQKQFNRITLFVIIIVLCTILLSIYWILTPTKQNNEKYETSGINTEYELQDIETEQIITADRSISNLKANANEDAKIYCDFKNICIDDVDLNIYCPQNCKPILYVGEFPKDKSVAFVAQAADTRADNGEIAGACVLDGLLLSKGQSKRGFCAILGDSIVMGMEAATPYLEIALDNGGDFFRQYSIIHNGEVGERVPKGKSIRRALCYDREGDQILVIETKNRESYDDFRNALMDLPDYDIKEAIALVGHIDPTFYRKKNGETYVTGIKPQENTTYIVWKQNRL